jgi:hypothetical protein
MSETQPTILWTMDKFIAFYKKLYKCVHDEGMSDDEVFTFEGHEFVIGYAKYLVHHLQSVFSMEDKKW